MLGFRQVSDHTQGKLSAEKLDQTVPFLLYVLSKHFLDAEYSC